VLYFDVYKSQDMFNSVFCEAIMSVVQKSPGFLGIIENVVKERFFVASFDKFSENELNKFIVNILELLISDFSSLTVICRVFQVLINLMKDGSIFNEYICDFWIIDIALSIFLMNDTDLFSNLCSFFEIVFLNPTKGPSLLNHAIESGEMINLFHKKFYSMSSIPTQEAFCSLLFTVISLSFLNFPDLLTEFGVIIPQMLDFMSLFGIKRIELAKAIDLLSEDHQNLQIMGKDDFYGKMVSVLKTGLLEAVAPVIRVLTKISNSEEQPTLLFESEIMKYVNLYLKTEGAEVVSSILEFYKIISNSSFQFFVNCGALESVYYVAKNGRCEPKKKCIVALIQMYPSIISLFDNERAQFDIINIIIESFSELPKDELIQSLNLIDMILASNDSLTNQIVNKSILIDSINDLFLIADEDVSLVAQYLLSKIGPLP